MDILNHALLIAEDDQLRSQHVRELIQGDHVRTPQNHRVRIPKVLVQYWHDLDELPTDVQNCLDSWDPLIKQGFRRILFDDKAARTFIHETFGDIYATAFDGCRHPAMRCDYFRLCYICRHGGFYVDADEVYQNGDCEYLFRDNKIKLQPLCYDTSSDTMIPPDIFIEIKAFSPDWIFYVNNNPLVAPPFHPVVRSALARSTRLLTTSETAAGDIQSTTGPGNLTASLVRHYHFEGRWK